MKRTCSRKRCGIEYEAKRVTSRYCSKKCHTYAARESEYDVREQKVVQQVNLADLRSKIANIIEKPKKPEAAPIYRPRPQGPQAPAPDQFFEEETLTTD